MLLALALLGAAAGAGCNTKPRRAEQPERRRPNPLRRAAQDPALSLSIGMQGNRFQVDDDVGRRLLTADVRKMDGKVLPGKGIDGPVRMVEARCRLYDRGKHRLNLTSPEATWNGEQLVSDRPTRAVTAEGDRIMDAAHAAWTASNNRLDLTQAKLQSLQQGRLELTAEAPTAWVQHQVATMPGGAAARTPAGEEMSARSVRYHFQARRLEGEGNVLFRQPDGRQLRAERIRWEMETGRLEADGNVELVGDGARVTGQRLRADTKLQRGRVSGGTRVVLKRIPDARRTADAGAGRIP
jgi:lipopolysaccharide export system protein LptA